jgi:peptidylprolyl isomerase
MKFLAVIVAVLCIGAALSACGDDSSAPAQEPLATSADVTWKQVKTEIADPQGPPPTELVVENLKEGSGPPAKNGDNLSMRYVNFDYNTGQAYEERWSPPNPFVFELGAGEALDAWETGLKGMKKGGRRVLIVPAKEAYGKVPQIYVLELTSIE